MLKRIIPQYIETSLRHEQITTGAVTKAKKEDRPRTALLMYLNCLKHLLSSPGSLSVTGFVAVAWYELGVKSPGKGLRRKTLGLCQLSVTILTSERFTPSFLPTLRNVNIQQ